MELSPDPSQIDIAAAALRAIWAEMVRRFGFFGVEPARQLVTANWFSAKFRQIDALLARYRAGKLRRCVAQRTVTPGRKSGKGPEIGMSRKFAWLCLTGKHHAAAYGGQIQHVLSQPEMAALLEVSPQAKRILRPLCRALAVTLPWVMDKPPSARKPRVKKPRPKRPVYPEDLRSPLPRGVKTWIRKEKQMEKLLKLKHELVAKMAQERRR